MTLATGIPKARFLARLIPRVAAWFLATLITVLSLAPPSLRPETGTPHNFEHFAVFYITGFAFGIGYDRNRRLLSLTLVAFAATIELAQIFVPERHARVSDFIVDAAAACIGVLLAALATYAARTKFPSVFVDRAN
jgi:VanZ family protein